MAIVAPFNDRLSTTCRYERSTCTMLYADDGRKHIASNLDSNGIKLGPLWVLLLYWYASKELGPRVKVNLPSHLAFFG